jgi:hypothetical protein
MKISITCEDKYEAQKLASLNNQYWTKNIR